MKNRQYVEMLAAAVARLDGRDPAEIASRAGAEYDPQAGTIGFVTFGRPVRLYVSDWHAEPAQEMWHHVTVLQYLGMAEGGAPSDRWIGMGELSEGGLVRGASFDREIDGVIARELGRFSPETILSACGKLGGEIVPDTRADLCAVFRFMPRYPLMLNLWYADDEFPASGKVLLNDGVRDALGTEAAGTAAGMLARQLCAACDDIS